jgi:hypothetical protein
VSRSRSQTDLFERVWADLRRVYEPDAARAWAVGLQPALRRTATDRLPSRRARAGGHTPPSAPSARTPSPEGSARTRTLRRAPAGAVVVRGRVPVPGTRTLAGGDAKSASAKSRPAASRSAAASAGANVSAGQVPVPGTRTMAQKDRVMIPDSRPASGHRQSALSTAVKSAARVAPPPRGSGRWAKLVGSCAVGLRFSDFRSDPARNALRS